MGYKKLDEVMELLTDELDGFNRAIDRLEQLTENTDNIKIEASTREIQKIVREHLEKERIDKESIERKIRTIEDSISRAKIIPKIVIWIMVVIIGTSLVTNSYLGLKFAFLDDVRQEAYERGRQEVITSLRGYFDENPKVYESYEAWRSKRKATNPSNSKK